MSTIVVTPPEPIVSLEEAKRQLGIESSDEDALIEMLVGVATEEIDGPTGWLGRALGPQELELRRASFTADESCGGIRLPCPPLIAIVSVSYDAVAGGSAAVPAPNYTVLDGTLYPTSGTSWPAVREKGEVRIRYRAGYDSEVTGPVPLRAKQAILLSIGELRSLGAQNVFLTEERVDGVSSQRYAVSAAATEVVHRTVDRLLAGLRVYA